MKGESRAGANRARAGTQHYAGGKDRWPTVKAAWAGLVALRHKGFVPQRLEPREAIKHGLGTEG